MNVIHLKSFWFTFSVLAPALGPMATYEQGLTLKRKRGTKCHPCALENRSAVRRDEKEIVRTVQTVVTKQAFGPLFSTQDALQTEPPGPRFLKFECRRV